MSMLPNLTINTNNDKSQCIVYLESYYKIGDGIIDAFIDFRKEKDLGLFNSTLGVKLDSDTYIELKALKTSKRLFRGCYYQLNLSLLRGLEFHGYGKLNETNIDYEGLFGGFFELGEMNYPTDVSEELLQTHDPLDSGELSKTNIPQVKAFDLATTDDMNVFVKDVDQANWNELRSGEEVKVLFDAGSKMLATKTEVLNIFNSRRAALEQAKPVLVISHWDVDHIHCLKYLDDGDIKACFSKLICVDKVKSLTSSKIRNKLRHSLGDENFYSLAVEARTDGVTMHRWQDCGCVTFYKGESSRNINYCGLVMFVNGKNKTANYTGDCRLSQADDVYKSEQDDKNNNKHHVLISPHHGGDCDAANRHYSSRKTEIAISVGFNNSYGHPDEDMVKYLKNLGKVEMTKDVGDIIYRI